MKPLYFVHIPKTAGTSFRNFARKYFGKNDLVCDYGPKAPETSGVVKRYSFEERDYWPLYQHLVNTNKKMLCGHFPAIRYMPGMGVENAVIFFREPIQRLVSEYLHFQRHQSYKGSFRDFYSQARNINTLSRVVEGVPIEAVGVIGLTEYYEESLQVFNSRYQLKFSPLMDNVGRESIEHPYDVAPEHYHEVVNLNSRDVELYKKAVGLFVQRQSLMEQGLIYAHAQLATVNSHKVIGWAWWEFDSDDSVDIDVRINGEIVVQAQARAFRPALVRLAPPRGGHVEFAAAIDAKPGDAVDCVVHKTGQVFPPRPMIVE